MPEKFGWTLNDIGLACYERYIVQAWMGAWAQTLVETACLRKNEQILDIGCGTGIVARKAAALVGNGKNVIGLDISEGMIRSARTLAEREGLYGIEWRQGDAASMPFDDEKFEVVLCQQGLQFCSDPSAVLREIFRVMREDGRLAISLWRELKRQPYFMAIAKIYESFFKKEATMVHKSFPSSSRERLRKLIIDAGFRNIHIGLEVKMARFSPVEDFIPGYLNATPLAQEINCLNEQERSEMYRQIVASISNYIDDDGLAAPMESYVIAATK
jgi:ubiquinone/menaquinone biosynthesis C-methylase UbiE